MPSSAAVYEMREMRRNDGRLRKSEWMSAGKLGIMKSALEKKLKVNVMKVQFKEGKCRRASSL